MPNWYNGSMKKFNRDGFKGGGFRSAGRGNFKSGGFRNDDRGERSMHYAVCSDCGRDCEVPFRPMQGKPVYCNDCFRNHKDDERSERSESGYGRPERFEQRGSSNRFGGFRERDANRGGNEKRGGDDVKKQLEALNFKMDKLIKLLSVDKVAPQPVVEEKKKDKKKVKLAKPETKTKETKDDNKEVKVQEPVAIAE
jgi:CxxC-x17-CxxC domain-containing protein